MKWGGIMKVPNRNMKNAPMGIVNPVAKAMLQERKSPQVVLPKKGNKAKRNRQTDFRKALKEYMDG